MSNILVVTYPERREYPVRFQQLLSRDTTEVNNNKVGAEPHFIGKYSVPQYARVRSLLSEDNSETFIAPPLIEAGQNFIGRYAAQPYWRPRQGVLGEDEAGLNAPGPPAGGEPHFRGSYKAIPRYARGPMSEDATGITYRFTLPGAEPNFIGLYVPAKYSRVINHEDDSGISVSMLNVEAQPHFIGVYKHPPYPTVRLLLHEDSAGVSISAAVETNPNFIGKYKVSSITRIRGLSEDIFPGFLESPVSVVTKYRTSVYSRAIPSADLTGFNTTAQFIETPINFIALFRGAKYSQPIISADATGISIVQLYRDVVSPFIARYNLAPYWRVRGLSEEAININAPPPPPYIPPFSPPPPPPPPPLVPSIIQPWRSQISRDRAGYWLYPGEVPAGATNNQLLFDLAQILDPNETVIAVQLSATTAAVPASLGPTVSPSTLISQAIALSVGFVNSVMNSGQRSPIQVTTSLGRVLRIYIGSPL